MEKHWYLYIPFLPSVSSCPRIGFAAAALLERSGTVCPEHSGTQWSDRTLRATDSTETANTPGGQAWGISTGTQLPCVNASYPVVHIQQAARNDCVQENVMCWYNVIQILSLLDLIPQLIPRALQHLEWHKHNTINNRRRNRWQYTQRDIPQMWCNTASGGWSEPSRKRERDIGATHRRALRKYTAHTLSVCWES